MVVKSMLIWHFFILLFTISFSGISAQELTNNSSKSSKIVNIAIYGYSGIETIENKWTATLDYLSDSVDGYTFQLLQFPGFAELQHAVENKRLDFVFTQPAAIINLSNKFGIARIATLINGREGSGNTHFAGVIFTRSDRIDINSLKDAKNKSIMGFRKESFGGWQIAYREFLEIGIDPFTNCSKVNFSSSNSQKDIVDKILKGTADIGVIRTGVLEYLDAKGEIQLEDYKILDQKTDILPLVHSTRLYPEWAFAALKNTDETLARKVAIALFQLGKDTPAAVNGGYTGWRFPLSYNKILELLKIVKAPPFDDFGEISLKVIIKDHWVELLIILLLIIYLIIIQFYIRRISHKLKQSNEDLESRVKERTARLQSSETKLKEAQAIAKIGNWELDLVRNDLYWSEEIFRIFDLKPNEIEASYEGFLDHIHPEDREKVNNAYTESLRTKSPYSIEHRLLLKNNIVKYVREQCKTYYDPKGKALKSIGSVQDITKEKLAEESLKESQIFNQTLLETSPELIYVYDIVVRKNIYSNQGITKILGYGVEEIQEMGESFLPTLMHPVDFNNYLEKIIPRYQTAKEGELIEHEYRMKHKNGTWTWLQSRELIFLRAENGAPKQIFGITADITERLTANRILQQSERELKEAQRIGQLGSWYLDIKTNEVVWTKELYQMYGFDSEQPPPPYTEHQKLFTPESWKRLSEAIPKTSETGIPYELELETVREDESNGWMWVRGEQVKEENGSVTGLRGIAQDITKRKQSENELEKYRNHLEDLIKEQTKDLEKTNINLKKANERLLELDHLKSMFIASMSHELRTPLNSIIGFTGLILQGISGNIDEEAMDDLGRVYASSKHLLNLINDVIDISKIEADKLDVFFENFSLVDLTDNIMPIFEKDLKSKNLDLKVSLPSDPFVYSDKKRLYQCIINLVGNAVKYTKKGQVFLKIDKVDSFLKIQVEDTGIGITEEDIPKLFKSFVRLDSPIKELTLGTGLGLYLTKKIVDSVFQGDIGIKSKYGTGSTFTINIPLQNKIILED